MAVAALAVAAAALAVAARAPAEVAAAAGVVTAGYGEEPGAETRFGRVISVMVGVRREARAGAGVAVGVAVVVVVAAAIAEKPQEEGGSEGGRMVRGDRARRTGVGRTGPDLVRGAGCFAEKPWRAAAVAGARVSVSPRSTEMRAGVGMGKLCSIGSQAASLL